MKVITLTSLKGGVGKSLISFNLGGFLYSKGKRVLLIDLDSQCNSTKNMTHPNNRPHGIYKPSVIDILEATEEELKERTHPDIIIVKNPRLDYEGFDLLPSSRKLANTETVLMASSPMGFNVKIKNWIETFKNELESLYDYIIIDVSPYFGAGTYNALTAANEIFLITDSSENSLDGVNDLNKRWSDICKIFNMKNQIKGIIANNIDIRHSSSKFFIDSIRSSQGDTSVPIFTNYIKNSAKIKDSEYYGPVALSDSNETRNNVGPLTLYKVFEEIMEEGYL